MASSSASSSKLPLPGVVPTNKSCAECLTEISALASRIANICTGAQSVTTQPQVLEMLAQLSYTVAVQQQVIEEFGFTLFGRAQSLLQPQVAMSLSQQQSPILAAPSSSLTRLHLQQTSHLQAVKSEALSRPEQRPEQTEEQDEFDDDVNNELDDDLSLRAEAGQADTPSAAVGFEFGMGLEPGYQCDICPKRLASLAAMRQHRYIHDESPRFSCELCGKGFKQSAGLYQHKRVVHKNE